MIVEDWISDSDMSARAFIVVAVLAKPAECRCVMELDEFSLCVLVSKSRDSDLFNWCLLSARNWVWSKDEVIQGAIFGLLFDLR